MIKEDKLYVWHQYAAAIDKNPVYPVSQLHLQKTGTFNGASQTPLF